MSAIDRPQLTEQAARHAYASHFPNSTPDTDDLFIEATGMAAALPTIAAGVLAPIRVLHRAVQRDGFWRICDGCGADYPCATVRLLDEIEAELKA